MKKKHIIFLQGIAIIAILSGCGSTSNEMAGQNIISETETSTEEITSIEEIQEKAQEEAVLKKVQEAPEAEADTTIYGNTAGNILGGGLLLEDDDYYYLYHGYDNCVYRTEKKTGVSDKIADGYCLQLNMVDGKIYANNAQDEVIVEINPESGETAETRKGSIEYLLSADGELYFTDISDNSLRKYSLGSREETVLVDQAIVTPCIYKDAVYFAMDNDEHYL